MKVRKYFAAGGMAAAAAGASLFAASAAQAAPTTVTVTTHIYKHTDTGHGTINGGVWAIDDFNRTLTVTLTNSTATTNTYTAQVSDSGAFVTVAGDETPNQSVPGEKISHDVKGTFSGTVAYTLTAPAGDDLGAAVPSTLNDSDTHGTAPFTTDKWPSLAFATPANVTVTEGAYSFTYTTPAGESWTDSSAVGNNDGNAVADGNITGLVTRPPAAIRLSHGHGTATAPTRETVSYRQSGAASWDEFYIVGPGGINGHKGWVHGSVGTNFGYYWGLEAHHGYTVYYTPVEGKGSDVQVPGSRAGYVYFVS